MASITTSELYRNVLAQYRQHGYLTPAKANYLTLEIIAAFSDQPCDATVLKYLARFLTVDSYVNLVDERTINHICGYPLCGRAPERNGDANPLRVLLNNMKMHNANRIDCLHDDNGADDADQTADSLFDDDVGDSGDSETDELFKEPAKKTSKGSAAPGDQKTPKSRQKNKGKSLTPFSYLNNYCCKKHHQCSRFYQSQLLKDALFIRENLFVNERTGDLIRGPADIADIVERMAHKRPSDSGDQIAVDSDAASDNSHGKSPKKHDVILLEEVWRHQAKHNQMSLVDVLHELNLGASRSPSPDKPATGASNIVPDELMKGEVVEKFPENEGGDDDEDLSMIKDEDDMSMSIEERAKLIEGYVPEI